MYFSRIITKTFNSEYKSVVGVRKNDGNNGFGAQKRETLE